MQIKQFSWEKFKRKIREIDLFDFTSFFAWTFINFLAQCEPFKIKVQEKNLFFRVKLIQWNSDAYDQDLVERTRDACKGDVDIVLGCLGLGAPLQRSFKCLKKGGTAFVTEEINEKVLKSLQKMAEQQSKSIQIVQQGSIDDLKKLLALVADEVVSLI